MIGKAKKILIVEDDRLFQQMYFDRLVKEGYQVLQAFNGKQGMAIANNYHPDIIVLDIMLPGGLNGFDLLAQLRRNPLFNKTPILILTALESEEKEGKLIGATEYLFKSNTVVEDMVKKIKNFSARII